MEALSAGCDLKTLEQEIETAGRTARSPRAVGLAPHDLMHDVAIGSKADVEKAVAGERRQFETRRISREGQKSQLRERTEQFQNLTAYVDRMMLQYYPEFAWAPLQEAA